MTGLLFVMCFRTLNFQFYLEEPLRFQTLWSPGIIPGISSQVTVYRQARILANAIVFQPSELLSTTTLIQVNSERSIYKQIVKFEDG